MRTLMNGKPLGVLELTRSINFNTVLLKKQPFKGDLPPAPQGRSLLVGLWFRGIEGSLLEPTPLTLSTFSAGRYLSGGGKNVPSQSYSV